MGPLDYAKHRLTAYLSELQRVKQSEFPYPHARHALDRIEQTFEAELSRLKRLDDKNDPDVVRQACSLALQKTLRYLPLLGFILRSTNVRNAFEVFRPLLNLARKVLEPGVPPSKCQTRLILSSEWDYSPFTYNNIPDLPGYVLIGLPATESGNPLLIPLAGHELGHPVWQRQSMRDDFYSKLRLSVFEIFEKRLSEYESAFRVKLPKKREELFQDLYFYNSCMSSIQLALWQAEETFCDFLAVRLFGGAYLHAFAYLLSPNHAGKRPQRYPNMVVRARNLSAAANQLGAEVPSGYVHLFQDLPQPDLSDADAFKLSVADAALENLAVDLVKVADKMASQANIARVDQVESGRIFERFKIGVPAERATSLANILNAAWMAFDDPQCNHILLKELVLKNIEVFDIEQIVGGT